MFWTRVLQFLEDGQKVFLAMVAENTRHSPGTRGARLLVSEKGETAGTIGGGIMELRLLEQAKEALRQEDFLPQIRTLHHRKTGPGEKSGMICAGSQTNLCAVCLPSRDRPTVGRLAALLEEGRSGTLTINPSGLHIGEEPPDL
ncbi:MAG: XdhC family protein, partial [Acidobacteriota bacterium]